MVMIMITVGTFFAFCPSSSPYLPHHPHHLHTTTILLTINTSGNGSMESVTASPVDPLIVKTICEQLDVINKLLVKVIMMMTMTNKWNKIDACQVDDDIESVDQKAETALADFEDMDRWVKKYGQEGHCGKTNGSL